MGKKKKEQSTKKSFTQNSKGAIGRTLQTSDNYLPTSNKGKSTNPKGKRRVAVIDSNESEELAVVRMTTQQQGNTSELKGYNKGNKKKSFFKHFVEIEDDEGKPIKADGNKFKENPPFEDLSQKQVEFVRNIVLNHVKQSGENRSKLEKLHKKRGD